VSHRSSKANSYRNAAYKEKSLFAYNHKKWHSLFERCTIRKFTPYDKGILLCRDAYVTVIDSIIGLVFFAMIDRKLQQKFCRMVSRSESIRNISRYLNSVSYWIQFEMTFRKTVIVHCKYIFVLVEKHFFKSFQWRLMTNLLRRQKLMNRRFCSIRSY
jgi:hypothetical protein